MQRTVPKRGDKSTGKWFIENSFEMQTWTPRSLWAKIGAVSTAGDHLTKPKQKKHIYATTFGSELHCVLRPWYNRLHVYFQYFSFPTLTSISTITALLLCLLLLPLHPFLNDCAHHFYYLSLQGNIWQYLASVFDLIISQPTHHFLGQFAYSWCNIGISSLIFSVHDSTLYIITLGFGVVLNQASGC